MICNQWRLAMASGTGKSKIKSKLKAVEFHLSYRREIYCRDESQDSSRELLKYRYCRYVFNFNGSTKNKEASSSLIEGAIPTTSVADTE